MKVFADYNCCYTLQRTCYVVMHAVAFLQSCCTRYGTDMNVIPGSVGARWANFGQQKGWAVVAGLIEGL